MVHRTGLVFLSFMSFFAAYANGALSAIPSWYMRTGLSANILTLLSYRTNRFCAKVRFPDRA